MQTILRLIPISEVLNCGIKIGLPSWFITESACNAEAAAGSCGRQLDPWVRKIPWRRAWQPTPIVLPGESHGQRNLASYSPWGCKESTQLKILSTRECHHQSNSSQVMNTASFSYRKSCWVDSNADFKLCTKSYIKKGKSGELVRFWLWYLRKLGFIPSLGNV